MKNSTFVKGLSIFQMVLLAGFCYWLTEGQPVTRFLSVGFFGLFAVVAIFSDFSNYNRDG